MQIADFGLSRALIAAKHETLPHGTVTHMAPEMLEEGQMSKVRLNMNLVIIKLTAF